MTSAWEKDLGRRMIANGLTVLSGSWRSRVLDPVTYSQQLIDAYRVLLGNKSLLLRKESKKEMSRLLLILPSPVCVCYLFFCLALMLRSRLAGCIDPQTRVNNKKWASHISNSKRLTWSFSYTRAKRPRSSQLFLEMIQKIVTGKKKKNRRAEHIVASREITHTEKKTCKEMDRFRITPTGCTFAFGYHLYFNFNVRFFFLEMKLENF